MEFFDWRAFKNRREVGGLAGLTPTPYQSGESARKQGITKSGNRHVRWMTTELAWSWVRYQPESALSQWFQQRYGGSGNNIEEGKTKPFYRRPFRNASLKTPLGHPRAPRRLPLLARGDSGSPSTLLLRAVPVGCRWALGRGGKQGTTRGCQRVGWEFQWCFHAWRSRRGRAKMPFNFLILQHQPKSRHALYCGPLRRGCQDTLEVHEKM